MLKKNKLKFLIFLVLTTLVAGQLPPSVSQAQEKYITPGDAVNHVGEIQTVCGEVGKIKIEKLQPILINLYQQENARNFTLVIYPSDKKKFTNPPIYSYLGKKICVKGLIKTYLNEPEIILTDPSQITIESSQ
jgi:DNA/RNA endonuclease YhcR with UshA esterase domain